MKARVREVAAPSVHYGAIYGNHYTMRIANTTKSLALTVGVSLLLGACGGGGGGDSTQTTPVDPKPPVVTPPTYPDASPQLEAFNGLNAERKAAGLATLKQSTELDTSAANHNSYLVTNKLTTDATYLYTAIDQSAGIFGIGELYEDPVKQGFTGITPNDRAGFAKFSGAAQANVVVGAASGGGCVDTMLGSVYRRLKAFGTQDTLGVAWYAGTGTTDPSVCGLVYGTAAAPATMVPGTFASYPYAGKTGVPITFTELPSAVPDLTAPGYPITVMAGGAEFTVDRFTVTPAGGAAVDGRIIAVKGAAGNGVAVTEDLNINQLFPLSYTFVPLAKLTPSTTYTVTFEGKINGVVVKKTWDFATAAK